MKRQHSDPVPEIVGVQLPESQPAVTLEKSSLTLGIEELEARINPSGPGGQVGWGC